MSDNERNDEFEINDSPENSTENKVTTDISPVGEDIQPTQNGGNKPSGMSPLSAALISVSALLLCTAILLFTFISLGKNKY